MAAGTAKRTQPGVDGASQPVLGENAWDGDADDEGSDDVDIIKIEACTTSTNASDDYAHRGSKLANFTLYTYRMYDNCDTCYADTNPQMGIWCVSRLGEIDDFFMSRPVRR